MAINRIKLFVTVPEDLEDEGAAIGAYAVELNRIYASRDIQIEVALLEEDDPDPCIGFDDATNSDYFYALFFCRESDEAVAYFNEALGSFRHDGHPKVYTYFKELLEDSHVDQGVKDFMDTLGREIGHFYSRFSSIDSIKLDIILEISRDFQGSDSLETHNGSLYIDGKEALELTGLPAYACNERLAVLQARKQELDEELQLSNQSSDNSVGSVDPLRLNALVKERMRVADTIEQIEGDILKVAIKLMVNIGSRGQISKRIQEAHELFQQGKLMEARRVLEDEDIDREREARRRKMLALRAEAERLLAEEQEFVDSRLINISLIAATEPYETVDKMIMSKYADCWESTLQYNLDPGFLSDYVAYLHENKHFDVLETVSDHILRFVKSKYDYDPFRYGHAYLNTVAQIGFGHIQKTFENSTGARIAESMYLDVMPIAEKRADELNNPEAKKDYARLLNYLGIALVDQQLFDRAYDILRKSVALGQEIVEVDQGYRRSLAITYNFLSLCFYRNYNCSDEAVGYAEESVRIRRELFEEDPDTFRIFYARAVYVLGAVYRRKGCDDKAEEAFVQAIEMLHSPMILYSDGGRSNLSSAEGGYAKLLIKQERFEDALPILEDARDIRTRLYENQPDTYGRPLLFILRKLERVYEALGKVEKAEEIRDEMVALDSKTQAQSALPDSD